MVVMSLPILVQTNLLYEDFYQLIAALHNTRGQTEVPEKRREWPAKILSLSLGGIFCEFRLADGSVTTRLAHLFANGTFSLKWSG